eukprot:m51a1_g12503 hypothetical protein (105) ;mRNA; f:62-376
MPKGNPSAGCRMPKRLNSGVITSPRSAGDRTTKRISRAPAPVPPVLRACMALKRSCMCCMWGAGCGCGCGWAGVGSSGTISTKSDEQSGQTGSGDAGVGAAGRT